MENRESVYTQLASTINKFTEHKLTKQDFYTCIVALIEMANEDEKNDRTNIEKFWKVNTRNILRSQDIPYSNWKDGFDQME